MHKLRTDLRHRMRLVLAERYIANGDACIRRGEQDEALAWYNTARKIQEAEAPNSLDLADTYTNMGDAYNKQRKYEEARDCYNQAHLILEKMPNNKAGLVREVAASASVSLAETYRRLSCVRFKQGNYDIALAWYRNAREIQEVKTPSSLDLAETYANIGHMYYNQRNCEEALHLKKHWARHAESRRRCRTTRQARP